MSLNLVAFMPDPQFKADRLDPERYRPADLLFSCVSGCMGGLEVDPLKGIVTWTPGFEDAGTTLVKFSVRSGIYSSERDVLFIVSDVDRGPEPSKDVSLVFQGEETKELEAKVVAEDPDGDSVFYECVDGCLDGMTVDRSAGVIKWTPTYFDSGEKIFKVRIFSSPTSRPVKVMGWSSDEKDQEKIRNLVEEAVINRNAVRSMIVPVSFVIANKDRPPEAVTVPPLSAVENENLSFSVAALDFDGDEITFKCDKACPKGLTLNEKTGEISWTPSFDQAGDYSFSVGIVSNGKEHAKIPVTIKVENVNRPPVFRSTLPTFTVKEGIQLNFAVSVSDPDKEDTPFVSCSKGCPDGLFVGTGGAVSWTPNYDQSGEYPIEFTVTDGKASATTSTKITVVHVNRAPYFFGVPEQMDLVAALSTRVALTWRDDDKEDVGKIKIYCSKGCPQGLSMDETSGTFRWQPTYDQAGSYDVTFAVSDGQLSTEQLVKLNVIRLDRSPRFAAAKIIRGEELQPLEFSVSATDPDGDAVFYSCSDNCVPGLAIDTTSGAVSWTPTSTQSGTHVVTFRAISAPVWDATEFKGSELKVTIIIKNFNRPPTIVDVTQTSFTVFEGGLENDDYRSAAGRPFTLQLTASDPDGDPLAFNCVEGCPPGLVVDQETGLASWTPEYTHAKPGNAPYTGIKFAATDGEFASETSTISITVINVNRPPTVSPIANMEVFEEGHRTVSENSPKGFPLSLQIAATDLDAETLTYRCASGCPTGFAVDSVTGIATWTPTYADAKNPPANDPYTDIVIGVADGLAETLSNPFSVKVKNVNRFPKLAPIELEYVTFENGHVSADENSATTAPFALQLVATDADGDVITYRCLAGCPKGLVVDQAGGGISWRPGYLDSPTNGSAKPGDVPYSGIVFSVSDSLGATVISQTSSIRVKNVDRSPVFTLDPSTELRTCEEPNVTGRSSLTLCTGQATTLQVTASDPDGDPVSFRCDKVEPGKLADGSDAPSLFCTKSGSTYIIYGDRSGRGWLRLTSGGLLSANPGYLEAQRGNAAFTYFVSATSRPTLWASPEKSSQRNLKVRPVNMDRGPSLDQSYERNTVIFENEPMGIPFVGEEDPDKSGGEPTTVTFVCSPLSPETCPSNMIINENDIFGYVAWTPSFAQAKRNNAPYYFKFRVSSVADDFYPDSKLEVDLDPSGPDYPPIFVDSDQVNVVVKNSDHVPKFEPAGGGFNAVKVDVEEPDFPSGAVKTKTVRFLAKDFDKGGNGIQGETGYTADMADTETAVSYFIDSCEIQQPPPSGGLTPVDCSTFSGFISLSGDTLTVSPNNWDTAIAGGSATDNGVRKVWVRAEGGPKAEWGWTAREWATGGDLLPWSKMSVDIAVKNIDRPPTPSPGPSLLVTGPPAGWTLPETEGWSFSIRASDPDGDQVTYCVSPQYYVGNPSSTTASSTGDGLSFSGPGYKGTYSPTRGNPSVSSWVKARACTTPNNGGFTTTPPSCSFSPQNQKCTAEETYSIRFTNVDRPPRFTGGTGGTYSETQNGDWRTTASAADDDDDPIRIEVRSVTNKSPRDVVIDFNAQNPNPATSTSSPTYHVTSGDSYNLSTRTSGPTGVDVRHRLCYADPPVQCFDVPDNVVVSFSITDVDRPPTITRDENSQLGIFEGDLIAGSYRNPGSFYNECSMWFVSDEDGYDAGQIEVGLASNLAAAIGTPWVNMEYNRNPTYYSQYRAGITAACLKDWRYPGYNKVSRTADPLVVSFSMAVCYKDGNRECSTATPSSPPAQHSPNPPTNQASIKIWNVDRPPIALAPPAPRNFPDTYVCYPKWDALTPKYGNPQGSNFWTTVYKNVKSGEAINHFRFYFSDPDGDDVAEIKVRWHPDCYSYIYTVKTGDNPNIGTTEWFTMNDKDPCGVFDTGCFLGPYSPYYPPKYFWDKDSWGLAWALEDVTHFSEHPKRYSDEFTPP